jgi:hypothetical protein
VIGANEVRFVQVVEFPQVVVAIVRKITLVTKIVWGFLIQSLPLEETQAGFYVKCPLLISDENNILTFY